MDDRQRQFAQFATAINQYASSNSANGDRGPPGRTSADGRSSTGSTSSGSSSSGGTGAGGGSGGGGGGGGSGGNAAAALWGDLSRAFPFNYSGISSGSAWPPPSTHQGGSEYHRYGAYGGFNDGPPDNRATSEVRRVPSKGETKATPPLPAGLSPNVGSTFASLQQLVGIPILAQQYAAAAAFSALPPSTRAPLSPIPPIPPGRASLSPTGAPPSQLHGSPPPLLTGRHYPSRQRQHPPHPMLSQQKASSPPVSLLSPVGLHPQASPEGGSNLNGEYLDHSNRGDPPHGSPAMRKERLLDHAANPNPDPLSPLGRLTPPHGGDHERSDQVGHHHPYAGGSGGPFYGSDKQPHLGGHPGSEASSRGHDTGGRSGSESEGDHRVRHRRKQDQPRRQTVIYSNPGPGGYSAPPPGPPSTGGHTGDHCHPPSAEDSSSDDSQGYEAPLSRHRNGGEGPQSAPSGPPPPAVSSAGPTQLPISQAMSHALSHPFLAAHLNTTGHGPFLKGESQYPPRGEYNSNSPLTDGVKDHCYKEIDPGPLQKSRNNIHHYSHYKGNSYHAKGTSKDSGPYSQMEREQLQGLPMGSAKDDYGPVVGCQQHVGKENQRGPSHYKEEPPAPGKGLSLHPHSYVGGEGRTTPQAEGDINRPASTTAQGNFGAPETSEAGATPPVLSFNDPVGDGVSKGSDPTPFRYGEAAREKESSHLSSGQFESSTLSASVDGEAPTVERRSRDVTPASLPSTLPPSGIGIPNSNCTNPPTSGTASKVSDHSKSSNALLPSPQPPETCCYEGKRGASPSSGPGASPTWKGVHSPSPQPSPAKPGVGQGVSKPHPDDNQVPHFDPSSSSQGGKAHLRAEAPDDTPRESKVKIDTVQSGIFVPECHEEALVNGTSSPSPQGEAHVRVLTPKPPAEGMLKVPERGAEPVNGDLEHLLSPGKHKKRRRTDEEEEEVGETKRRTRQKRPVSYVEDETDPVLETSEDSFPAASPVKKRGRKVRDKAEVADHPAILPSHEAAASKELRLRVYDGGTNCLNQDPHQRLGPSSSPGDGEDASLHGSDRLLQLSGKVPPNLAEPLHIDTSGAFKGPFRLHGGPNPPTPTLHSPDVYDFHDADGDPSCRGNRGKRGRKRGSPKKQSGQATPEYLRSNLSPRGREGSCSRSPRSPKFFSSTRSAPDGLAILNERPRLGARGPEDDSSNGRISNGALPPLPLPLPSQDPPFCRYPLATGHSQSPSLDIPVKPMDMRPPASLRGGSPSVLAGSSSGRIVDEVEKQLAALHKEHLPDTPTPSPREAQEPTIGVPGGQVFALDAKKSSPLPEGERKPVHKPMLSVVPLEQLTYEGLRNKTASRRSPLPAVDASLSIKSPSTFFSVEPPPFGPLPDDGAHPLGLEPPPPQTDPLALPSPPDREKLSIGLVNPEALLETRDGAMRTRVPPGERGKEPMPLGRNELCKGVPGMGFRGLVDSQLMDRVASSIPITEQSVHMVSVAEASPPVAPGTRKRGGSNRGRTAGLPTIAPGGPPYSNGNSIASNVTSTMVNISAPATSGVPMLPRDSVPEPQGVVNHAIPGCASPPSTTTKSDSQEAQPQLRRRSRRGANPRGGSPSSPPQLNAISRPPSRSDDPGVSPPAFNNRVPPPHKEALDSGSTLQRDLPGPTPAPIPPVATVDLEPEGGETLEDIAKFLEATAPSSGVAHSPGAPTDAARRFCRPLATPGSSSEEVVSSSASSSANTSLVSPLGGDAAHGGSSYREGRPKRVSRPPPQMNDGEMNDLLLLLNMEDEESEDEDYIPREEDEDEEAESDGRDTADDETPGEPQAEAAARGGVGQDGRKRSRPPVDANFTARSPPLRKKAAGTPNKKGCSVKKVRVVPSQLQVPAPTTRRRALEDGGERRKDDRRGPLIRLAHGMRDPEVILNAPDRDDDEQDRARKGAASFSLDSSSATEGGGSSRGPTKVGFNSTLHNNYDAFNKDLHWFCAFCKHYSHFWGLGDLFGPFYIKGVSIQKKNFPDVVDGQVACGNGHVGSPTLLGLAVSVSDSHGLLVTPTKQKNKRASSRGDSNSGDTHGPDAKRLEMGGSSPPSRFVPAATPARMLGRCASSTSNGGRFPVHSPQRSPQPTHPVEYSMGGAGEGAVSPPGTECWLHEECVLWASGVTAVNSKLYGLDDALIAAQDSLCIHCDETGATVSCLKRGCHDIVHVPCATRLQWTLDDQTFQSFCPKHTPVVDKAFTGGSGDGGSRKANTSSQHLKKL